MACVVPVSGVMKQCHISSRENGRNLLERIARTGSLNDALDGLDLDREAAWNYLVAANNLSDRPLIRSRAEDLLPTRHARDLLGREESAGLAFQQFLARARGGAFREFSQRHDFLRRLDARTSARNQFYCVVKSVRRERVNAVVVLDIGGGDELVAHITSTSAAALGLAAGRACHALIDPAWLELQTADFSPYCGRRNEMAGRVVRCLDDPVDSEVSIELTGGRILVATMSRSDLEGKALGVGCPVRVLIHSSQIVLAVEDPASAG